MEISSISAMVPPIAWMALTASPVAFWMSWICAEISSVAFAVWLASALTSLATTANPRPCSPARAASIVALSASRLVWLAMFWISVTTSPIFWVPAARPSTTVLVRRASLGGLAGDLGGARHLLGDAVDRRREFLGRRRYRFDVRGGLASRRLRRLPSCRAVSALLLLIDDDRPCISLAATATASTMLPILRSKPAASSRRAASRSCLARRSASMRSSIGAGFGGTGGFGLGAFLRRGLEQMRERQRKPDQYAGLDQQDDGVKDDAAEIGAARNKSPPEA